MKDTITLNIDSLAKDRLNEMLDLHPKYKKRVLKAIDELCFQFKVLSHLIVIDKDTYISAIRLFTDKNISKLTGDYLPTDVITHLSCLLDTISKRKVKELTPRYIVVDKNGKALTKDHTEKRANYFFKRLSRRHPDFECKVLNTNQMGSLKYEKNKDIKEGDLVKMSKGFKLRMIESGDKEHIEEFGNCIGVVEGKIFPNGDGTGLNVRWKPSNQRYGYAITELIKLRKKKL